jgi:hypothetical protein
MYADGDAHDDGSRDTPLSYFGPDHEEAPTALLCPVCGYMYRVGELVCANCQYQFSTNGRPTQVDPATDALGKHTPAGEVIMTGRKPIILQIGEHELMLPVVETLTLGRRADQAEADVPHIDLSAFAAEEHGISRLHARIRRKGMMVYIADLGSTNGTHLNGRRLIPDGERLLRDGDLLHLSRLLIRIRF